jgi:putative ABC transport system permease protein
MMQDLRAAVRAVTRRPGFAAVAVATLALGIGGNAAIFSVIDTVLLQPLPYPGADRLVMVWEYSAEVQQKTGFDRLPSSPGDVSDFRARNRSFDGLVWVRNDRVNLTGTADPERISAVRVSPDFFDVLGVHPAVGRSFTPEDTTADGRMVLIAETLWQRRFGSDADVSGRVISLNGNPATIVGVLPRWFRFPRAGDLPAGLGVIQDPEIWTLDILTPAQQLSRAGKSFALVGRLRDGLTLAAAEGDMSAIAADIAERYPESNGGWTVRMMPLREQLVGGFRSALVILLVAVGFVLLIACANVANLMLVRAAGRQREMCVRLALGAARRRLVKLLLLESLVIALAAGAVGLVVAWGGLIALRAFSPSSLAPLAGADLDWRVLGFTLVVSTATGLLFGIVPAFQASRSDINDGLRDGGRGTAGSRRAHRVRNTLVVVEVALAMVLLVGAMLLLQTFVRLLHVDPGFRPDGVLAMEVTLPRSSYPDERAAQFFERVTERLREVPGVEVAGVTSALPLTGVENLRQLTIEGRPRPATGQELIADYRVVSRNYFQVMGIPAIAGEPLPDVAGDSGPPTLLVNETLARQAWPDRDPVGRKLKLTSYDQDSPWYTVAGVVGDTRHTGLDSSLRPQVYVSYKAEPSPQMVVVLRAAGDPTGFAGVAKATVLEVDRDQPVGRIRTMRAIVGESVSSRRFTMALVGTFALLAFGLSLVGLYAVVSHSVAERTQEMGLRLALGASPWSLLRLVIGEGVSLTVLGVIAGLGLSMIVTRFMRVLLFGVGTHDTMTFVFVPALLLMAAVVGCLIPARRAMRVDPMSALRSE